VGGEGLFDNNVVFAKLVRCLVKKKKKKKHKKIKKENI